MTTFFEGSGVTPTEMDFISKRVRRFVEDMDTEEEPSFSVVLGALLEQANKDKVTPRDAALMGFIIGGGYSVQRMMQRDEAVQREILANIRGAGDYV